MKNIDTENHSRVVFIRVEPIDLQSTLKNIIDMLFNLSWINQFDEEYVRDSFKERAVPTIMDITQKLKAASTEKISSDAGEYVVSEVSRNAIVNQLKYLSIPLSELYSKQVSGNPGFDFHTQNDCEILIFGEAKYLCDRNAYGTGLKQVVNFIKDKKDIKDISDLRDFIKPAVLVKATQGIKGFAVGFSAKEISSDQLIENIKRNQEYKELLAYEEIVLVAVNI